MELVLATLRDKILYLRIQSSHGMGGWWLSNREDFVDINDPDWLSLEDFVLNTGQPRIEPLEILARGLIDDW